MKKFAPSLLILALSLFAGRLLAESWEVPIAIGALLAACAAAVLVLTALIIKAAGRDELKRAKLGHAALERIKSARKCSGCWGPLERPYVRSGNGFRSLVCCERRRDPQRRNYFDASEIKAARRAGLIGG